MFALFPTRKGFEDYFNVHSPGCSFLDLPIYFISAVYLGESYGTTVNVYPSYSSQGALIFTLFFGQI